MKHLVFIFSVFCLFGHESIASDSQDINKIISFSKSEMLLKKRVRTQSVQVVKSGVVYDFSPKNLNWNTGYTTLFIGLRKKEFPQSEFLKRLTKHVRDVQNSFGKQGLKGYFFSATEDYEIAWQNWKNKAAVDHAFYQMDEGKKIAQDAQSFMENGFYKQMNWSTKNPVKVLFVITSHEDLGTTGRKTGFYLSEITHPYFKLSAVGIPVDFASPQGGKAPMDENSRSEKDPENEKFLSDPTLMTQLEHTLKLAELKAKDYSAIVFVGGHGTMWDFPNDQAIENLTTKIFENDGIVSAICHGPAALVNVKLSNGHYLIAGKHLTSFTEAEETAVKLQGIVPFSLEQRLSKDGALFKEGQNWSDNVVVDGKLVTAQNPQSASSFGGQLAKMLTE